MTDRDDIDELYYRSWALMILIIGVVVVLWFR